YHVRVLMYTYVSKVLMHAFLTISDSTTTEIYSLSLHDALPICLSWRTRWATFREQRRCQHDADAGRPIVAGLVVRDNLRNRRTIDRKSTRLNSSHVKISYAVFCLKKKNKYTNNRQCNHNKQTSI